MDEPESRRRRWVRWVALFGGFATVVTGIVLAVMFMSTPAALLDDGPISPYDATHTASMPQPVGVRTGLWVEIPALHIALPIHEGDGSNNIPDWVALHYPGTAIPGAAGNSSKNDHGIRGMVSGLLRAQN